MLHSNAHSLCLDNPIVATKLVASPMVRHYSRVTAVLGLLLVREKRRERAVLNLVWERKGEGGRAVVHV